MNNQEEPRPLCAYCKAPVHPTSAVVEGESPEGTYIPDYWEEPESSILDGIYCGARCLLSMYDELDFETHGDPEHDELEHLDIDDLLAEEDYDEDEDDWG